jgi:hypothetical protein
MLPCLLFCDECCAFEFRLYKNQILIVLRGVVYGLECNFVKLEGYWSKLCQNNGCFLLFNVECGFDVILFNESDWISEVVTMFVGLGCPQLV